MALSPAQKSLLKTTITNDPTLFAFWQAGGIGDLERELNLLAQPAFWVWRTSVTRAEIYHGTSVDATTWSWTVFKQQNITEQNAWVQMFMGDTANMSLPNLRAGVNNIFTGSAPANAQATHILTIGRRLASIAEKLFAVGPGTTVTPATMSFEGHLSDADIQGAMQS